MGNRQNLPHSQLTETKLKNKTTHLQKKSSATFTENNLRGPVTCHLTHSCASPSSFQLRILGSSSVLNAPELIFLSSHASRTGLLAEKISAAKGADGMALGRPGGA
jgi:hypothetical protein